MKILNCYAVVKCSDEMVCDCGGIMEHADMGPCLMSNPPKYKIVCPFCGNSKFILESHVHISFKVVE